MSDLAVVLELLHRPSPRFRTLRAEGREWRHEARLLEAFQRGRTRGSLAVGMSSTGSVRAVSERPWRLWMQPPELQRTEFGLGDDTETVVVRADTSWSWSPARGALRHHVDDASGAIGPGAPLVDPVGILLAVDLDVLGRAAHVGRACYEVRGTPIAVGDPVLSLALHALGAGADEYLLLVDAERGILLRSDARLRGQPFQVVEITEAAFDEDLPPDLFSLELPAGEEFEPDERPFDRVPLGDVPSLVPFTVFVPPRAPIEKVPGGPRASVDRHDPREGRGPSVMLCYSVPKGDGEYGNLWIKQSGDPFPAPPPILQRLRPERWRKVGEFSEWVDDSMGYRQVMVRLARGGTHIELDSPVLGADGLLEIARSLVPLPPEPPQLVPWP